MGLDTGGLRRMCEDQRVWGEANVVRACTVPREMGREAWASDTRVQGGRSEDRTRGSEDLRMRGREDVTKNAPPPDGIIPSLLLLLLIETSFSSAVTSTE